MLLDSHFLQGAKLVKHSFLQQKHSYVLSVPALVSNTRSASIAAQNSRNLTQHQEVVPPSELATLVMPSVFMMSDLRPIYHGDLAEPVMASPANHMFTSSMLLDMHHSGYSETVWRFSKSSLELPFRLATGLGHYVRCVTRFFGNPGRRESGMIGGSAL